MLRRLPRGLIRFAHITFAFGLALTTSCGSGGENVEDAGTSAGVYQVQFETTAGTFVLEVNPSWAPIGAARFRELVTSGYYDGCRFFRVVPGFVVQFGINGDPATSANWADQTIQDDPVVETNTRGYVTFAQTSMRNSRTTQLFINFGNNGGLDAQRFAPFAHVVSGMDVVDAINYEYRELPDQSQIMSQGNAYLDANFPNLDSIIHATIL